MKPSLVTRKPVSRAKAKNAALLNLLATPGLGSLLCRRWIEGIGQLLLAIAGCVFFIVWILKILHVYYGLMFSNEQMQPVGRLAWTGAILFALSWIWSVFTSVSLLREATDERHEAIKNFGAPPPLKWDAAQIAIALASLPNWKQNGDVIFRTFQFRDFPAAIKFVNAAAEVAEHEWHHPDIDIRWNKVTLALTTHDAGGLTEKDFALAKKFDALSLR